MDNLAPNHTPPSSSTSTSTSTSTTPDIGAANPNNRDQFLHHLNKLSHNISKPSPSFKKPNLPEPTPVQPPVYNINKSDFRDVVQRLTGSPAPTPSRLHRIRPPPLAQLSLPNHFITAPHSPLPPLPSCHAAADSPISAYMRFMHHTRDNMNIMFPPPDNFSGSSAAAGDFPNFVTPLPFGCFPSPKSPSPLMSPKLMMPPTVPGVPSPK